MPEEPSYILDIQGLTGSESLDPPNAGAADRSGSRPWIGIHYECCGVYTRIYRNRQATAYEGHCPRCQRPMRIGIGTGGTHHRIFRAS